LGEKTWLVAQAYDLEGKWF